MGRRMRMLLSFAVLAGVVAWIVLAYVSPSAVSLPQFTYAPDGVVRIFPGIMVAGFLVFLVLQIWLVVTTARSVQHFKETSAAAVASGRAAQTFDLNIGREIFLTALPIVFTVILGLASMTWWQRLAALQ